MTPVAVTAAGGVLYRETGDACEVLLIFRNGVWDLPKGKREEDESIAECARREVAEEVGIPLPRIEDFLTKTYHEYERNGTLYGKTTHWYRMRTAVQDHFTPEKGEGIKAVQWMEIDRAEKKIGYENLREVLRALKESVQ